MPMSYFLPSLWPPLPVVLLAAMPLAILALFTALKNLRLFEAQRQIIKISMGVAGVFLAFGLTLVVASVVPTFIDFYIPAIYASPWVGVLAVGLGLALFIVRKKWLGVYGAIEILGALVTILICGLTDYGSAFERGAALLGATYFLVRGLDNADKGDLMSMVSYAIGRWRMKLLIPPAMAALTVGFVILPGPDNAIEPPFLEGKGGERLPVSPMMCGAPFIICDQKAWFEKKRLSSGSDTDRAAARQAAEQRYQEHLAELERDSWWFRPKALPLRE